MSATPRPRNSPPILNDEQDQVPDLLPHLRADPSPFLSCSPEHSPRTSTSSPLPPLHSLTPALPGFRPPSSSSPSPSPSSSASPPPPPPADLPTSRTVSLDSGSASSPPLPPLIGRRRSISEWLVDTMTGSTPSSRSQRQRDKALAKETRARERSDEKRRREELRVERRDEEARRYEAYVRRWQAENGAREGDDVETNYLPPGGWSI
ncbi:hypothetical protein JCM5296_000702 [Sporobolomyces johnsonii]